MAENHIFWSQIKKYLFWKSVAVESFRKQSGLSFFYFVKGGARKSKILHFSQFLKAWCFFNFCRFLFFWLFWKLYAYWIRIWPRKIYPGPGSGLKWPPKFQNGIKSKSTFCPHLFTRCRGYSAWHTHRVSARLDNFSYLPPIGWT